MATPAEIWGFNLAPGVSAEAMLLRAYQQAQETARIHGLVASAPLVVTETERSSGGIVQTITASGETVTIERLP